MKKLTPKTAKLIAQKYFKRHKDKAEQNFARIHTSAVVEVGVILAKKFKANASVVEISAWIHDIGSVIEMPNHAIHSLNLLKKEGFEISTLIEDCVLNHGIDGKPISEEAKILQMADKLSFINIPILKLLLKQKSILPSDVEFVNKMTAEAIVYLKKLSTKDIQIKFFRKEGQNE
jgi:HD superfamily phosphodiesterase